MYLSWAAYFEGASDEEYFKVILPRVMSDLIAREGVRSVFIPEDFIRFGVGDRSVENVSSEACNNKESFHLWYIHADTGGRNLELGIDNRSASYKKRAHEMCGLRLERSVVVAPRKETEAWVLADRSAVLLAFGVSEQFGEDYLPARPSACEGLVDPKNTLDAFAKVVNKRRYRNGASSLFAAIAQRQSLERLRQLGSYLDFERNLKAALFDLGCLARP